MADREKVIDRLQKVSRYFKSMLKVGYDGDSDIYREHMESVKMAIALLKEQEAVEPILEQDSMVCGVCGHEVIWQKMIGDGILVDEELDYCPHCGRKVKWE